METMSDIERLARAYAADQRELRFLLDALQAEVDDAKRRALKNIRRSVDRARNSRSALESAVRGSKPLFVKPRTIVVDGIKLGWQKQKGSIVIDDAEATCRAIRKRLPDMADALIQITERPLKDALARLPADELRRLGVELSDDNDVVVIRDTESDVDKLVAALLADEVEA